MITTKEVNELLTNYTVKSFFDFITLGDEFRDYRSKFLMSHMWIERLFECIIIKKFENHVDLKNLKFSEKQKIIFQLGIINEDLNHELKIFNQIRNAFAHEIEPIRDKIPNLIKQFKFYPKKPPYKDGNLIHNAMVDGQISGMIIGYLERYLAEYLWKLHSEDKTEYNFT